MTTEQSPDTASQQPETPAITIRSELERTGVLSEDIWKEARVFLAVAKLGTIASAARSLRVSELTVHRSVRRLEDRLGSTLIRTSNRGITLTPKGQEFCGTLLVVDKHFYAAAAEARTDTSDLKGVVSVSITEGLAAVVLAPALREFDRRYPHIELHIKAPISKGSLNANQTDIMVGFMFDQNQKVTSRSLGSNFLIPCASRSYIRDYGMPNSDNIEDHFFVDSEQYARNTSLWATWHDLVDRGRCRHFADTSMVYAMMVRQGVGIGLLSNFATTDSEIVALDLPARATVPLFATAVSDRLTSRPVRIAFDFLSRLYGAENPWFARQGPPLPQTGTDWIKPTMFRFWDAADASDRPATTRDEPSVALHAPG